MNNNELKFLFRKFYYLILKEHQKKFSGNLLKFSNAHLRMEFRNHYNVTDTKYLQNFVEEWSNYYVKLINSKDLKDLTQNLDQNYLNDDQKKTIKDIKNILKNDN